MRQEQPIKPKIDIPTQEIKSFCETNHSELPAP